jgi:tetratricopeptide (TPR) repeat protein
MTICRKYGLAMQLMVSLAFGFLTLACRQLEAQETPKQNAVTDHLQTVLAPSDLPLPWQELMKDASSALSEKNFAKAELNCADALKTASQFGPADSRVTTNLVLLAEIYQAENKSNLAEQTLKDALASSEKASGTNDPSLVMPLEHLAKFYYFAQHRYDLATPLSLRILQLVENNLPRDDVEIEKRALAVAVVYRLQSRYAEAEPFYNQVLDLAEKNRDDDLFDDFLATANFYHDWGKSDQAEALCQRALVLQEKVAAANTNSEAQMNLAVSLYGVAENCRNWGKLDQAESLYRRSLEIVQKNAGAGNSDLARPLAGLAATLAAQGKTNQAAALYQQAFTLAQDSLGPEDAFVKTVLDDYTAMLENMNLSGEAKSLRAGNQWLVLINHSQRARHVNALEAAAQMAGEALDIARNFESTDTRLGKTQVQLAEIYRQQNKTNLAEQAYATAIASFEKAVGTNSPDLIPPLEYQADFYYTTKVQYDQVASIYLRILNIVRMQKDKDPLEAARRERNLADVYRLQNKNDLAEAGYKQALAIAETATNSVDDQVQYLQLLADFYLASGRGDDAELMATRALAVRERAAETDAGGDAQLNVAIRCDALAQIYLARNKPQPAELFYGRSLEIAKKIQGAESPELVPRLVGLATALRAQKKFEAAEAQYKQALRIAGINAPPDATAADVLEKYAALLQDMNRLDEAKLMLAKAGSIRRQN